MRAASTRSRDGREHGSSERRTIRFRQRRAGWWLILGAGLFAGCAGSPVVTTSGETVAGTSAAPSTSRPQKTSVATSTSLSRATTTKAPSTTTTAAPAGLGSTLTLAGSKSKLAVTLTAYTDPFSAGQFSTPDQGRHFVGVQLRLVNTGTTMWNDSPSNGAKLVDAQKQEYRPTFIGSLPELHSLKVAPGDTRLGWIVFAVPDAVQLERFTLALDSGFADDVGQWKLGTGSPNDPAPPVSMPGTGPNDSITLTGRDKVTMQVTLKAVVDNATPGQYSTVDPGNRLLAVQVEFANTGTVGYSDSPTNGIELIDAAGQTWTATYVETTAGPGFAGSVQIPPNDARAGWVVFELPADQPAAKIQIALDSGFADVAGEWKVTAG